MSLKVSDIIKIIESYAPLNLKEDFDNPGFMIGNSEDEVHSILVALDCTMKVIDEAIDKRCNFIFTHHPLLFNKPASITNKTLLGRKILKLIQNNINVYSSHTNLDSVLGGINDILMKTLGFENCKILDKRVPKNLSEKESGIGRLTVLKEPVLFSDLCKNVKKALNIRYLRYSGNLNKKVSSVAVITGAGQSYFNLAVKMGADCIITGDTSYHNVNDLYEDGVCIIDAEHFYTEWTPLKTAAKKLKLELKKADSDIDVINSDCAESPYKFME